MVASTTQKKVLVTYATWLGSTGDVAQEIGEMLRKGGHEVDVLPTREVTNLSPYQAVILGGPIRGGQWMPDVIRFLEANHYLLRERTVAYFVVCLTMRQSTMGNRQIVQGYLKPVLEQYADLRPIDIGYFGGKVDFKQISGPQKFMLWLQPKLQGDFRDWGAIREWAGRLALRLVTEQPTQVGMA